jgi:FdhE protein
MRRPVGDRRSLSARWRREEGVDKLNMDLVTQVADDYLKTAVGSDGARLRFLKGLWEIQSLIEGADRPYDSPDGVAAREAIVSGRPLFLVSPPEVPVAEYADAVSRIARYASDTAGLPAVQAAALQDADFAAAIGEERLAGAVQAPEAFAAEVAGEMGARPEGPLTPATVAFVLMSALVPFLTGPSEKARDAVGEFGEGVARTGQCPVCGAAASMGRMGESTALQGAERELWCSLCHAEWRYERIRCVRCGCRNPDSLHYTYIEGDPAHRVHLCDECHGYTRFVFVDELDRPISMVVEDAVTATLDAVALQKGYTATGDGGTGSC